MNAVKSIGVWLKRFTTLVSVLSYAGIFVIMILIVADVCMRYFLNSPIVGAYEIVQYMLFSVIFASFAYCQSERGHVHLTMILILLPRPVRFFFYSVTGLLSTILAGLVGYAAFLQANLARTSEYVTGVLRFSVHPFYWLEGACMFIFAIAMFYDVVRSVIAMFNKEFAEDIQSTWS